MRKLSLISLLFLVTSCHSNPYDGQPMNLLTNKPVQDKPTLPGFTINAPAVVDVTENSQPVTVPVSAQVLSGSANISFDNLPAFASWDPVKSVMTLTPPVGASVDPNQPLDTSRRYQVSAKAASSDSPNSFIQQTIVIVVHHKAETLVVKNLDSQALISEGQNYQTSFQVVSQSFAKGPFYPQTVGLPEGVSIVPTSDPSIFNVNYKPGFGTITTDNYSTTCYDKDSQRHLCKVYQWTLNVADPRGDSVSINNNWQILDARQVPTVIMANSVTGNSAGASFEIQAEDPNSEIAPTITVTQTNLGFGNLTTTVVASSNKGVNGGLPYTLAHVALVNSPAKTKFSTEVLNVRVCVNDMDGGAFNCIVQPVTITYP